jgi:hypothetical protein
MVCPGLGEWRLGYRRRGAAVLLLFFAACAWMGRAFYVVALGLAETAKATDPTLVITSQTSTDIVAIFLRLSFAILKQYRLRREAIHHVIAVPSGLVFGLFCFSLVQAFYLARHQKSSTEGGQ